MKINQSKIGPDSPCYIIAELSANHNGNLQNALDTIRAAKEIGANAVKIQTYTADTITLNVKNKDFLIDGGTLWDGRNLYELYEEAHTPWDWHKKLFDYARDIGIDIFSSPFDKSAVDFLEQFDPPAYKIASFEITDYNLVRYTASKLKPIIISTGIGTFDEIKEVVNICREVGNNDIILLKCTSAYPAPLEDANLLTIKDLKENFNVIAGFSDHTLGVTAPIAAVSLGAKVIEKHLILDKSIGGADSEFSLEKKDFAEMIKKVRDAEKMLGKVDYEMTKNKKNSRRFSRSLYISKNIKAGEVITEDNVRSVRPGLGLHPKHFKKVLGKKIKKNMKIGDRLNFDVIDLDS
ncbi:MAG: pseudaminic acid synthase [Flavobacteriaceae bacterium]|nr:pseudaminic acid synthase [Flavobacteriaceae bacterium]|tara:strand:+ start:906 stop:1955 length:1050 start_codon:yes stop_codon:yes gene_type:complete